MFLIRYALRHPLTIFVAGASSLRNRRSSELDWRTFAQLNIAYEPLPLHGGTTTRKNVQGTAQPEARLSSHEHCRPAETIAYVNRSRAMPPAP
jgi:hypothetical protein